MLTISCNQLRFSQPSIKSTFRDGRSLKGLILELEADTDYVHHIRPLRIFKSGKHYVSLDNRRLACLLQCSRCLNRVVETPCILYRQNYILSRFGFTQVCKVVYYFHSRRRGAFVTVVRRRVNTPRFIRVLGKKKRSVVCQCSTQVVGLNKIIHSSGVLKLMPKDRWNLWVPSLRTLRHR